MFSNLLLSKMIFPDRPGTVITSTILSGAGKIPTPEINTP
jgi:hypothetical protein